ncbi:hypothetical protein EAE93_23645 [Photorhabdus akhurstii]|nr:hypothetical protein [Photorhabdus akhurstii]
MHERRAQSTTLSGDSVTVQAGNDLNIIGSNVAGTQDVNLTAGNQLTVTTADEARHETHFKQEKKSGLMGTGGIGFTVGKASQKSTTDIDSNLNKGSTVGSSQGSVTFSAGKQLNLHGSDVVAGRDMQLSGQNINITSAENSHTAVTKTEQKQSGLTVALSGTAGGALNSAVQTVQAARSESDSRIKALQGTKAALSGVQAVQAARLANAKGGDDKANNNLVGVNLSYGSQSSRSELKQHQTTQQGSSLMTGDNLTLTASGTPDQNGDIRIQGGQLQAGKDLRLNASRDIQLSSSQNTEQTTGKNSSRGSSLGVGFTAGPGGTGINLSVSTNRGKGSESGNGVSHNETTLDAGQTVTLNAGRDATLKGAQVSGEQIAADVKRHLTLSSEQDSNRYDMKQQNVSAGISANVGPGSGGSLNLSASRDKIHSNFDSVQEQTGLFAGKGGYEVKVGEHTQLDGAVIASTADKDKNTLDTGTLGFGDIKNKADFKTEHHSVSISTGGSVGGMLLSNMAANTLGGANREGHAQSTTHAAVSDGTLIIRDKDNQQQDITTLSRDTDHANNALSPIFDKEKEQQRLKQAQLIGEISAQVIDIASTEGAIIATKAAHAKLENISDPDREAARKKLENAGKTNITPEQIKDQIYKTAYNQALNESGLGTGGKYHTALQAATAAIQGLAGGNIGQALAGGASPYLAGVIKDLTTDPKTHQVDVVTNTLAHAILGAVAAEVSGNNALAGAAGAAGGELAARELMKHIHGENVKVSDLSEEEKQTISTLSTLAAGLAGGIAGDSTGSAITGAQAGKNAVENNFLTVKKNDALIKALDDQKAGKNLLEASQNIVRLTNEDKASNVMLDKYRKGTLDEKGKQELSVLLNQYGYELQTEYGFSGKEAAAAIQNLVNGGAFVAAAADAKAYNEALSYLKTYSVHSGQAALGTDALTILPGTPGTLIRGSIVAGGSYQAGTGIGQVIDGKYGSGVANMSLGSLAIFGGVAGNKAITKPAEGIVSPDKLTIQESSRVLDKKTHTSIPKVTAELTDKETGKKFTDTNQGNRPDYYLGDKSRPTLINGRIQAKIEKYPGKNLPNGNMASAHAEVGTIQQAYEDGITIGREMILRVSKEPVCGYCRGDIAAMADKAGLKSLTIYEENTGKTLYWAPGMKSIKEKN